MYLAQFKRSFNQIIIRAKQQLREKSSWKHTFCYSSMSAELYAQYPFLVWASGINIDEIEDETVCCELFSQVQQYLWDIKSDWCKEYSFKHSQHAPLPTTTLGYRQESKLTILVKACLNFYIEISPIIAIKYDQYLRWDLKISLGTASAPFQIKLMPMKADMNHTALLLSHPEHAKALLTSFPLLEPEEYLELMAYIEHSKSLSSNPNPESIAIATLLINLQNKLCPQLTVKDAGRNHLFAEYACSTLPAPLYAGRIPSRNLTIFSTETGRGYYSLCRQALKNNELAPALQFIQVFYGFYRLNRFLRHSYMSHSKPHLTQLYERINSRIKVIIFKNEALYIEILQKLYDIETLLIHATNNREVSESEVMPQNFFPVFESHYGQRSIAPKVEARLSTDNYIAACQNSFYLENDSYYYDENYGCSCKVKDSFFIWYRNPTGDVVQPEKIADIKARIGVSPDALISQRVFDQLYPIFLRFTYERKLVCAFKMSNLLLLKSELPKLQGNSDAGSLEELGSFKRLFEGGQFTLYLRRDFQIDDMVEFARCVEQVLTSAKILPGVIPQSDHRLGGYVSMTIDGEARYYVPAERRRPALFMQDEKFANIVHKMKPA